MTARLIDDAALRDALHAFRDRQDAGRRLASLLSPALQGGEVVMAVPSGGVPVGVVIASTFSLPFELLIVRKIQVPWNTEAGIGAIDPDGTVVLNESLIRLLHLSEREVRLQSEKTAEVIRRRNSLFRHDTEMMDLAGRSVVIVDDGLASGYTMIAAMRYVRRRNPGRIVVAVPTAHVRTVEIILAEADLMVCPNIRSAAAFAVADAYRNWHDLTDPEVISLLREIWPARA